MTCPPACNCPAGTHARTQDDEDIDDLVRHEYEQGLEDELPWAVESYEFRRLKAMYPGLKDEDLLPMSEEQIAWVREQRD